MDPARIARIESATLLGERPRAAGCNAHMGPHGARVPVPLARVTLDDGGWGFGWSRVDEPTARAVLGTPFVDAFAATSGVAERCLPIEYPLWDLGGWRTGIPVYALAAAITGAPRPAEPVRVPCYDTSLYIDDLHLADDDAAGALIADEARAGLARGHRAFKIKVGRGNLHLPTDVGLRRDVAVVHAVRAAVGPAATVLTDANNGFTLNLARDFVLGTATAGVYWLEEAFHEDAILYRRLRAWMKSEGLSTLVADGEGRATVDPSLPELAEGVEALVVGGVPPSPRLLDFAREGLIDVVQYDILDPGLTRWLRIGPLLDAWGRRSAPHHYGTHYGNYASCHLGPAILRFAFAEWDEAHTPGLSAPGYRIDDGHVVVPPTPGFGLELDEDTFQRAVRQGGFAVGT